MHAYPTHERGREATRYSSHNHTGGAKRAQTIVSTMTKKQRRKVPMPKQQGKRKKSISPTARPTTLQDDSNPSDIEDYSDEDNESTRSLQPKKKTKQNNASIRSNTPQARSFLLDDNEDSDEESERMDKAAWVRERDKMQRQIDELRQTKNQEHSKDELLDIEINQVPSLEASEVTESTFTSTASGLAIGMQQLDRTKRSSINHFVSLKSWSLVKFVPFDDMFTNSPHLLPKVLDHCGIKTDAEKVTYQEQVKKHFKIATNLKRHNCRNRVKESYKSKCSNSQCWLVELIRLKHNLTI